MEDNLNFQIGNNNGIIYTVICQDGDNAILSGGNDYVVIRDLSNFRKLHSWCGGEYFPHYHDSEWQIKQLQAALDYFKIICDYTDNDNNDENEGIEN